MFISEKSIDLFLRLHSYLEEKVMEGIMRVEGCAERMILWQKHMAVNLQETLDQFIVSRVVIHVVSKYKYYKVRLHRIHIPRKKFLTIFLQCFACYFQHPNFIYLNHRSSIIHFYF